LAILLLLTGAVSATVVVRPPWLQQFLPAKAETTAHLVTEKAKKAPFLISLTVQGTLDSQKNASLINQVEGTTTIINIVPEGTKVKKGDVVCELDASALQDKLRTQEIALNTAESAFITARETLKIQLNQNESDISAAELAVTLADLDLEKFRDGEYPQQQSALLGKVKIAEEAYVQAKESYEFNKRTVEKGTTQQNVLEAARIKMQQADFDWASAREELKVLEEYTKKRTIAELAANAKSLVNELERVKIKAESSKNQYEKDQEAKQLTLNVEKDKLQRYQKQIEACTLRAPQDGEVVYANLQEPGRGRSNQQGPAIENGATVYERQAIINLPDVSKMKISCRVHESLIGAVRTGLAAHIRIDAFASEPFNGTVASVSSVPMTGRWPNMDLREYDTQIFITDSAERVRKLRPGLTASVEILVDNRDDVLQAPVQAVVGVADKHVAYVLLPSGRVEQRMIEIGPTNQSHVEILKGVEEGERLVMNPRSNYGEELAALESKLNAEKPKQLLTMTNEAAKNVGPPIKPAPGGAGPGGAGGPGGGRPGGGDPKAFFARLDKDSDGSLTKEEAPERMQANFAAMDTNSDGKVTVEEFTANAAKFRGGGQGGPGGAGPGGGGATGGGGAPGGGSGGAAPAPAQ
jgi:HlyD family secretion protein